MRLFSLLKPCQLSCDELSTLLQRCMKSRTAKQAKQIHAILLTSGITRILASLESKLVGAYASSGDLRYAQLLFNKMPQPNIFAFNWMISAMGFCGHYGEAIGYFSLIQSLGEAPNKYTFSVVLKTCVGLLDLNKGKEVHGVIYKMGFECDISVGNVLIDMYCKCGRIYDGRKLFDRMLSRDVVSWTSMISGYCGVGKLNESILLFNRMTLEGVEPNDFTWNAMLAGYAMSGDYNKAFMFFSRMKREGLVPDLVTWNALISGFARSSQSVEAVKLFRDMLIAGVRPNHVTVTGLLPACGSISSIHRGREIHGLIYRLGLESNVYVAGALIDMYSKCGYVIGAMHVFEVTPIKNAALWNAMIGGCGKHGLLDFGMQLFDRMLKEGFRANEVTLVCILSACSHGGLVEKGMEIFRSMKEKHGVHAGKEHYACIVDLLCRAGKVEEAYGLVTEMTTEITESIIGAFFNGCKIHGRRDLAEQLAQDLLRMEFKKPGGFVTLSNIYAADEEWEGVEIVRELMKDKGVNKKPGFSSVSKQDDSVNFEGRTNMNLGAGGSRFSVYCI
ncbi:hypothetical protein Ancab_000073 [Ancistrocladus abbreviatus]